MTWFAGGSAARDHRAHAPHSDYCSDEAKRPSTPRRVGTTRLQTALDRVEGCHEWSVKAFAASAPRAEQKWPLQGRGAAYLAPEGAAGPATRGRPQSEGLPRSPTSCTRADGRLRARHAPARAAGPAASLVSRAPCPCDGAYLVDDEQPRLPSVSSGDLAHRCPDADSDIRGPWPPSSFATLDREHECVPAREGQVTRAGLAWSTSSTGCLGAGSSSSPVASSIWLLVDLVQIRLNARSITVREDMAGTSAGWSSGPAMDEAPPP